MSHLISIRRALISVSNKEGIISLAKILKEHGCEIISTGGTRKKLLDAGVASIDVTMITGNPEAFDGRVKTISFNVESAILFDREKHAKEAELLSITPIDLVICNLYPFGKVLAEGVDLDTLVENIDIGGPTMIRSAAKNFKYVATVTDPSQYTELTEELQKNTGATSYEFRKRMMGSAFNHTADYDAMIAQAMNPGTLRLSFDGERQLRYGENSHQTASFYRQRGCLASLYDMEVLHGKELSFNNILDINAAIEAILEFYYPACSVVKHTNPCGLCEGGGSQRLLLQDAWAGDPVSAFGSIIAFNRPVELETVKFFELDNPKRRKFIEVVVAPEFQSDALEYLKQRKDLRIVCFNTFSIERETDYRFLNGSLLKQSPDDKLGDTNNDLINFGLKAIKSIKSNSIIIVRYEDDRKHILGMGAGQPNRLVATQIAIEKARANLGVGEDFSDCWLISDAFFPFPDCVEMAAKAGIKNIAQPGGSIRDKKVLQRAEELGVDMVMTGLRHFKH